MQSHSVTRGRHLIQLWNGFQTAGLLLYRGLNLRATPVLAYYYPRPPPLAGLILPRTHDAASTYLLEARSRAQGRRLVTFDCQTITFRSGTYTPSQFFTCVDMGIPKLEQTRGAHEF